MPLGLRIVALAACGLAADLAGCSPEEPRNTSKRESRLAMDTIVVVQAEGESPEASNAAVAAAWQEMERCLAALDWWRPGTDISRLNDAAGGNAVAAPPALFECLTNARQVYDVSRGAFDPTVGPLVDLWRQEGQMGRIPKDAQIAKALTLVGFQQVELQPKEPSATAGTDGGSLSGGTVRLPRKGMRLNLGAIAKGYIAQRMVHAMSQSGIRGAMVQAGGEVRVFGLRHTRSDAQDDGRWRVAVQDPRYPDDQSRYYTMLRVTNRAISTSGHYQRYRTIGGKRYSHIIDPRTGRPVPTGLASVTVVAPEGYLADGLATAVAVLGVTEGLRLVERIPDVECLLLEKATGNDAGATHGAGGKEASEPKLIAHRSRGFAALEAKSIHGPASADPQ